MISHRMRENRRVRALKLPKNIERLYKEGKCRECAVVVTRMDFAKILGKFTKVKIQYESSSPKTKKNSEATSPNSNARLKSNENGMVLIHRNAYNQHPVKDIVNSNKKTRANQPGTPRQANNVLKENNRLKRTPPIKDKNSNINISSSNINKRQTNSRFKQYGIVFVNPSKTKNDIKSKSSLASLVPLVDKNILPSEEWCIDYLPRNEEYMDDKVYDRIAAELEDLMNNEPAKAGDKPNATDGKVDDFPSIMDILNDSSSDSKPNDQCTSIEFKANLESSDVEAMLLGKSTTAKDLAPIVVDSSDMTNLIDDVAQLNAVQEAVVVSIPEIQQPIIEEFENPHSPSILDEALKKGIEEHLPCNPSHSSGETKIEPLLDNPCVIENSEATKAKSPSPRKLTGNVKEVPAEAKPTKMLIPTNITHMIFRKNVDGKCLKSVTCPKNLKYTIELNGKTVEFLGAPKVISSLEDLQVLLQIVNETELQNLYVYH